MDKKFNLAEALSKAQFQITVPKKDRNVDFTDKNGRRVKYSYADLANVIDCYKKALSENGLSVSHVIGFKNELFGLTTILLHSSGETIESWYPLPNPVSQSIKPQEFGSALTYARRYSVSSLLGIASEEDDDGSIGADTEPPKKPYVPAPKPENRPFIPKPKQEQKPVENHAPKKSLYNVFLELVKELELSPEEMPELIQRIVGEPKNSKELTENEIQMIINYLNFLK